MTKKQNELIEKFKILESELIDALKAANIEVSDDKDEKVTKAALKSYIGKVKKLKKIFDEYESVAKEIEDLSAKDKTSEVDLKQVVELRESDENQDEIARAYAFEDEVEVIDGKVLTKRKKKKTNAPVKEF